MSTSAQSTALERALTIRLNLQISISSLPLVAEWMDLPLTRWLESVPLPPEMPAGHLASFGVTIGSDLQRLTWGAYGDPAGFIPKMSSYFQAVGMSDTDTALIDLLGNQLEPRLVGSWIHVEGGAVTSGWHFHDEHDWSALYSAFGEHEARRSLQEWLQQAGITRFRRFTQGVQEQPFSEVEFAVPGVAIDDRIEAIAAAFSTLANASLPDHVARAFAAATDTDFAIAARVEQGRISRVSAIVPSLASDTASKLCKEAGVPFEERVHRVERALGSDGIDHLEYVVCDGQAAVDLHIVPSEANPAAVGSVN